MNEYQKRKENARNKAIRFQCALDEYNLSWSELAEWQDYFYKLARRYGLVKEFKENAII